MKDYLTDCDPGDETPTPRARILELLAMVFSMEDISIERCVLLSTRLPSAMPADAFGMSFTPPPAVAAAESLSVRIRNLIVERAPTPQALPRRIP